MPPSSDVAKLNQAIAAHRSGRLAEADKLYRSILNKQRNHFDALFLLGLLRAQGGNFREAEQLLSRATRLVPNHAAARLNLGAVLERLEDAVACYDKAIEIEPGYFQLHFNRGNALDAMGRPRDALESYDRAIAIDPNVPEVHYNRGLVLQKVKKPEDALASFDRSLALNPGHAEALAYRSVLLRHFGRSRSPIHPAIQTTAARRLGQCGGRHFRRSDRPQANRRLTNACPRETVVSLKVAF